MVHKYFVFLIEMNFLLKKKVLYFVYGLKRSVQVFIWLGLVLLAWGLLFDGGVKRTRRTPRVLNYITRAFAGCLIGAAIWLLKNLLVKLLASSFQCTRFFDRIQESIFHHYVLRTLSGPPLMELAEKVGSTASTGQLSFRNKKENAEAKEEVIDVDKLKKNSLDSYDDDDSEQKDEEITSEWQAKAAAYRIFNNVAKSGSK